MEQTNQEVIVEHEKFLIDYIITHFINKELKDAETYDYKIHRLALKLLKHDLEDLKRYK